MFQVELPDVTNFTAFSRTRAEISSNNRMVSSFFGFLPSYMVQAVFEQIITERGIFVKKCTERQPCGERKGVGCFLGQLFMPEGGYLMYGVVYEAL
jgi:hypothetical protein